VVWLRTCTNCVGNRVHGQASGHIRRDPCIPAVLPTRTCTKSVSNRLYGQASEHIRRNPCVPAALPTLGGMGEDTHEFRSESSVWSGVGPTQSRIPPSILQYTKITECVGRRRRQWSTTRVRSFSTRYTPYLNSHWRDMGTSLTRKRYTPGTSIGP